MTMQVSNLHLYTHETGSAGVSMPDLTTMVLIAGLAGVAGFTLGYGVRDFFPVAGTKSRERVALSEPRYWPGLTPCGRIGISRWPD
jgi:hypothetical protein